MAATRTTTRLAATRALAIGALAVIAATTVQVDAVAVMDNVRFALAVRGQFGFLRGLAFARAMRQAHMRAFPGITPEGNGFDAFDGGYEQLGSGNNSQQRIGILFLPGGGVEPAAYAPLLRRISAKLEEGGKAAATIVCAEYHGLRNPVIFPFEKSLNLLRRHPDVKTWDRCRPFDGRR